MLLGILLGQKVVTVIEDQALLFAVDGLGFNFGGRTYVVLNYLHACHSFCFRITCDSLQLDFKVFKT